MTCIVSLVENGKIYMGGDSICVDEGTMEKAIINKPKVFKKRNFIFGWCGSFRMGQILEYKFNPPLKQKNKTDISYMHTNFIDSLMKCFKKNDFNLNDENSDSFSILVGYNKRVYQIDHEYQIIEYNFKYNSCGKAESIALGAIHALCQFDNNLTPEEKITLALESAEKFSCLVSKPFTIISL